MKNGNIKIKSVEDLTEIKYRKKGEPIDFDRLKEIADRIHIEDDNEDEHAVIGRT